MARINGTHNQGLAMGCLVLALGFLGLTLSCAFALSGSRASEAYRFDFHYSVFSLTTNTWAWNEEDAKHWGTTFVIDNQGTMLTANHVVKDLLSIAQARTREGHSATALVVNMHFQNSGWSVPMKVVIQREDFDIAVLRPLVPIGSPERHDGDAPPFRPLDLDGRTVNITEPVYIVGYPINAAPYLAEEKREFPPGSDKFVALTLQTDPIVTTATVAGVGHRLGPPTPQTKGRYLINEDFLLLNHPGGPGNSGGPVISVETGKVIGVFVRGWPEEPGGYSFAVPTAQITAILNDLHASHP